MYRQPVPFQWQYQEKREQEEQLMKNYVQLAMRTMADQETIRNRLNECGNWLTPHGKMQLLNGLVGLVDEVGELASATKKHIEYNQPFDVTNVKEEIGDCFWRLAQICDAVGLSFEQCMQANIDKLQKRYPEKFSDEQAAEENRDRAAERQVLEDKTLPAIGDPYTQTGSGWAEPPEEKEKSIKEELIDLAKELDNGELKSNVYDTKSKKLTDILIECGLEQKAITRCSTWVEAVALLNKPAKQIPLGEVQTDVPTLKTKPLGHSYTRYCTRCKIKPIHKTNELGICTDCFMKHGEPVDTAVVNH